MAHSLKDKIIGSLTAPDSHVSPAVALEDLTAAQARRWPGKGLTTVWEQLAHLVFWQEFVLETVRGGNPRPPTTAEGGWLPMPPARSAAKAWDGLKARFVASLGELQRIARRRSLRTPVGRRGKSTLGEELSSWPTTTLTVSGRSSPCASRSGRGPRPPAARPGRRANNGPASNPAVGDDGGGSARGACALRYNPPCLSSNSRLR